MKNQKTDLSSLLFCIPFFGVLILQLVIRINAIKDIYFLYTSIFVILLILLISFLVIYSRRNPVKKKLFFNVPFFAVWLLTCGYMLYSDIVVFKKYYMISLIMLVLFTAIFIAFQFLKREDRDRLFGILINCIIIDFILETIFCFMFRPHTVGVRYPGVATNPNIYGMFIVVVCVCLITKLDHLITKEISIFKCIGIYTGIGASILFLYMTGARTSFIAVVFMGMLWFMFRLVFQRTKKAPFMKYIAAMIPVAIASFLVSYALLIAVPKFINHPVVFERDRDFLAKEYNAQVCYASNSLPESINNIEHNMGKAIITADEEPSFLKRFMDIFKGNKSLDTVLNGRMSIYKSFSGRINFKGHKRFGKKVNGIYVVHSHNSFIQIGYTYGLPAMILFIILGIFSIIYSVRYYILYREKVSCAAFPMLITVTFIIVSLTECLVIPMQSLLVFAYYLSIGEIMNTQKD